MTIGAIMQTLRKVPIDDSGRGTMRTELDEAKDSLDNSMISCGQDGITTFGQTDV